MFYKIILFFFIGSAIGCNSNDKNEMLVVATQEPVNAEENKNFFPVTAFIKGQIAGIKSNGINPMKVIKQQNRLDTSWVKTDNFSQIFQEFLDPVIDTANMRSYFSETKFEDQTLNTYTFIYSPNGRIPDSLNIKTWTVYISPETNKVTRIYLVKKSKDNNQLQLTWDTDKSCKIVTIAKDNNGKEFVKTVEDIYWKFD